MAAGRPAAAREQRERIGQRCLDAVDPDAGHLRRSELQGQRQPLEAATDRLHAGAVLVVHRPSGRRRPLEEEPD